MQKKSVIIISLVLVLVMCLSGCLDEASPAYTQEDLTTKTPVELVDALNIHVYEDELRQGTVPDYIKVARDTANGDTSNGDTSSYMYEMPDIEGYPPAVRGNSALDVEVFLPLEDSGSGIEEFVAYVAKLYNSTHQDTSITVRSMDASLAEDFIKSGIYFPKGYIASNELSGLLFKEDGINVELLSKKLVGNTMGVVITPEVYKALQEQHSQVDFSTIVTECMNGNLQIGYANPTNNPTGLNFVVSMLSYFDASNPFSMEATTDFSNFQGKVSSVAYSYVQMKTAIKNGTLNAFVTEYQAFINDTSLSGYVFIPFGVRHDYPLFSIGNVSEEERQVLSEFSEMFALPEVVEKANEMGFNMLSDYESTVSVNNYNGVLNEILSFWKTNKSSGKKIAVIFVCDISGSMRGGRIAALKESAINAMQYINDDCLVGLISFNDRVFLSLPLSEFDESQQQFYVGAIDSWKANGNTATNDALLIALRTLELEKTRTPDIKPIIFLLSDGETCAGYSLRRVRDIMAQFDTPIYTIGYEGNVSELSAIAQINNGVYLNASTDDVGYILKSLFNAEA